MAVAAGQPAPELAVQQKPERAVREPAVQQRPEWAVRERPEPALRGKQASGAPAWRNFLLPPAVLVRIPD